LSQTAVNLHYKNDVKILVRVQVKHCAKALWD